MQIFPDLIIIIGAVVLTGLIIQTVRRATKKSARYVKGKKGEKAVIKQLKKLDPIHYKVVNDIMLETAHGTTQIDHVVVSTYGIYPIETKNYKGVITGCDHDKEWTQKTRHGMFNFYNPVKQNYAHVFAITDLVPIKSKSDIKPIVAFSNDCIIDVVSQAPVINFKYLCQTIEKDETIIYTQRQINEIAHMLSESNIKSRSRRRKHVKDIRKKIRKERFLAASKQTA